MASLSLPSEIGRLRRSYELNELCHRVGHDRAFRAQLCERPEETLQALSLTEAERKELLSGDIRGLYERGVHPVLLVRLAEFRLFGLDFTLYGQRIRQAAGAGR